jgi:hypothetical protein
MTYGEFIQRRASIWAKIRAAERVYKIATDQNYTPLSTMGTEMAVRALGDANEELRQLIATWQDIQRTKRSEP